MLKIYIAEKKHDCIQINRNVDVVYSPPPLSMDVV